MQNFCTYIERDGTITRIRFRTLRAARYAAAIANQSKDYRAAFAARG